MSPGTVTRCVWNAQNRLCTIPGWQGDVTVFPKASPGKGDSSISAAAVVLIVGSVILVLSVIGCIICFCYCNSSVLKHSRPMQESGVPMVVTAPAPPCDGAPASQASYVRFPSPLPEYGVPSGSPHALVDAPSGKAASAAKLLDNLEP